MVKIKYYTDVIPGKEFETEEAANAAELEVKKAFLWSEYRN